MRLSDHFQVPRGFVITADEIVTDSMLYIWFDRLGSDTVAVRSSAMNEDSSQAAWAGQLETKLNVPREKLLDAVKSCRLSVHTPRAEAYAEAHSVSAGGVAVIIQTMLRPSVSGVAFSCHPVTREKRIVIEAVTGLGEQLVSGAVTPDTYIEGGEPHLAGSEQILSDSEIAEVTTLTRQVERFLGYPVDIEWAYHDDELYLLQARPITTL
ncbi:MAG: PEP/pyruvate-binding domain-containing protein [Candidatus Saccharimonadales bacterium]